MRLRIVPCSTLLLLACAFSVPAQAGRVPSPSEVIQYPPHALYQVRSSPPETPAFAPSLGDPLPEPFAGQPINSGAALDDHDLAIGRGSFATLYLSDSAQPRPASDNPPPAKPEHSGTELAD
jgi:hypothetical protein